MSIKLKKELGEYNEANTYRKINLSQVTQHALHIELTKRKKESEGTKSHEHN
jgi:hypothetical protein